MKKLYYTPDFGWTDYAIKKLGVHPGMFTCMELVSLIKKGFFIKKKTIYPEFSKQKVKFLVLPDSIFRELVRVYFTRNAETYYNRTGYSLWFEGYPVISK